MNRIGEVQLHTMVREAAENHGLDLKLVGYPVPPHRLQCGDIHICTGTPTEVAAALEDFLLGAVVVTNRVAAQCLAQGLTNEPPHVVVEYNPNLSGHEQFSFYTDTRGLVVVVVDRVGGMHPDDEGMVICGAPQTMAMLRDEGIRAAVIDVLAERNVHVTP